MVDPTRLGRSALRNDANFASSLRTVEALSVEKAEEKRGGGMPDMGGMGGMM